MIVRNALFEMLPRIMLGLFPDIEMRNWPMIPHDAGPDFATGALPVYSRFYNLRPNQLLVHSFFFTELLLAI